MGPRVLCRLALREARSKMEDIDKAMTKAEEVEGPFLCGMEVLASALSKKTLAACTSAAEAAQGVLNDALAFFATKREEISGYIGLDPQASEQVRELLELARR